MVTAARYLIGGAVATIVHITILLILVEVFFVDPSISTSIGFCVAVIVNYNFQYHWTFASSGPHSLIFSRYVVVTLLMFGVNLSLFETLIQFSHISYLHAQLIATGVVVVCNFAINRRYTFSHR